MPRSLTLGPSDLVALEMAFRSATSFSSISEPGLRIEWLRGALSTAACVPVVLSFGWEG